MVSAFVPDGVGKIVKSVIGAYFMVVLFTLLFVGFVTIFNKLFAETCVEKCYRIHGTNQQGSLCAAKCP